MRGKINKVIFVLMATLFCMLTGYPYTYASAVQETHPSPFILGNDQRMILIDAGHGGVDGGTSYGSTLEKNLTLEISRKLYLILRSNGYDAVLNRFGDYAPSEENRWFPSSSRHRRDLTQRKGLAEAIPTSVVVSIHVNWAPSSHEHGPLVLYRKDGSSYLLANAIQHQLNSLYHLEAKAKHGKTYFVLNQITATTVIVETGFISSPIDRTKLFNRRGQEDIAEAIAKGIATFLMEV